MNLPDSIPQNLQTANHYKQLHLGQEPIVFTFVIMLRKSTKIRLMYASLSTYRKNRTYLQNWTLCQHPSDAINNIQISSLPSSTTNQPINGGTTSRKESAPQTVSSIEGGTPFEQGVSSKEPHLNTVLHWIALEKEVTAWRNNSKKFECFMILCFWSLLHLVPKSPTLIFDFMLFEQRQTKLKGGMRGGGGEGKEMEHLWVTCQTHVHGRVAHIQPY